MTPNELISAKARKYIEFLFILCWFVALVYVICEKDEKKTKKSQMFAQQIHDAQLSSVILLTFTEQLRLDGLQIGSSGGSK